MKWQITTGVPVGLLWHFSGMRKSKRLFVLMQNMFVVRLHLCVALAAALLSSCRKPVVSDTSSMTNEKFGTLAKLILRNESRGKGFVKVDSVGEVETNRLSPEQRALFKGDLNSKFQEAGAFSFRVINQAQFNEMSGKLVGKGYWSLFFPSLVEESQAGHSAISVDRVLFNRTDTSGNEIETLPPDNGIFSYTDYFVAQFFEVSDVQVNALSKFFNDRKWFYFNRSAPEFPKYRTLLLPFPISKPETGALYENCTLFSNSHLLPYWQGVDPRTVPIAREVGMKRVSETPARQVAFNLEAKSYRGTFFVTAFPDQLKRAFLNGAFQTSQQGRQILLEPAPSNLRAK